MGLECIDYLQPRAIIQEMIPPSIDNEGDYSFVINALENRGYDVSFANRFPAAAQAIGDATDRERFLLIGTLNETIDFTSNLGPIQNNCRQHLDEPSLIAPNLWLRDGTGNSLQRMIPLDAIPMPTLSDSERLSYVNDNSPPRSRATLIGRAPQPSRFEKGTFIYSIDGILPTFSSWQNVLIYDDRDDLHCGVRYLSVRELALISGLNDPKTIGFLESTDAKDAHKYIGNAITGGTYFHIHDCVQKCLRDSSAAALGHHASALVCH